MRECEATVEPQAKKHGIGVWFAPCGAFVVKKEMDRLLSDTLYRQGEVMCGKA